MFVAQGLEQAIFLCQIKLYVPYKIFLLTLKDSLSTGMHCEHPFFNFILILSLKKSA